MYPGLTFEISISIILYIIRIAVQKKKNKTKCIYVLTLKSCIIPNLHYQVEKKSIFFFNIHIVFFQKQPYETERF